jgi:hypothetical protein
VLPAVFGKFQERTLKRRSSIVGSRDRRRTQRHEPPHLGCVLPFKLIHDTEGHKRITNAEPPQFAGDRAFDAPSHNGTGNPAARLDLSFSNR